MRVDQENNKLWRILRNRFLTSIVFPMLGAGEGGLSIESVAESIIPVAINHFLTNPNPTLKEIYFLAFKPRDRSACDRVLQSFCDKGVMKRLGGRDGSTPRAGLAVVEIQDQTYGLSLGWKISKTSFDVVSWSDRPT